MVIINGVPVLCHFKVHLTLPVRLLLQLSDCVRAPPALASSICGANETINRNYFVSIWSKNVSFKRQLWNEPEDYNHHPSHIRLAFGQWNFCAVALSLKPQYGRHTNDDIRIFHCSVKLSRNESGRIEHSLRSYSAHRNDFEFAY